MALALSDLGECVPKTEFRSVYVVLSVVWFALFSFLDQEGLVQCFPVVALLLLSVAFSPSRVGCTGMSSGDRSVRRGRPEADGVYCSNSSCLSSSATAKKLAYYLKYISSCLLHHPWILLVPYWRISTNTVRAGMRSLYMFSPGLLSSYQPSPRCC